MTKSLSRSTRPARARKPSTPRTRAAHRDAIRIVPLYPPAARLAAAAPPKLTYRGGPLIASVNIVTIFWGPAWKQEPQSAMLPKINTFFDAIVKSELIDQLAEYNVSKYKIVHGKRIATATITTPALESSVTDDAIQAMLRQQIGKTKGIPKATRNTLYFVYVQPGVRVVMGGSASCQAFCGYHNAIAGTNVYYAVMPYPGCDGCTGDASPFDALTSTSSHELCEAITDPVPGQGWYDDAHGENGDICAWETKKVGDYTVQLEWSNSEQRCV